METVPDRHLRQREDAKHLETRMGRRQESTGHAPDVATARSLGVIGAGDLAVVLGAWGAAPAGTAADLDRNGTVDAGDLGILLSFWGS